MGGRLFSYHAHAQHDALRDHAAPVTLWRAFLVLLWCAVFVCAAVLIGESTGRLDPSTVGRVVGLLPTGLRGAEGLGSVPDSATPTPETETTLPTPASVSAETCLP